MVEHITRETMQPLIGPFDLNEAVKANGMLHVAGQTGMDPATHMIVEGGLRAQATQAFRNIKAIVELAGGRVENLVSLTWYLAPSGRGFMEDSLEIVAAKQAVMPGVAPGSTAVRVAELLTPEILIEISAVAAL
jgi:2-iminobutanoate/2-iminopropanoate deaminase